MAETLTGQALVTLGYAQVRRQVYKTAAARYKLYEKRLGPLKETLGDRLAPDDA